MAFTTQPLADNRQLDQLRETLQQNVPFPERVGSVAAGAGLVLYGASRRNLGGLLMALVGGALLYRGSTGYCALYRRLGINSGQMNTEAGVPGNKGIKVESAIIINRPAVEVYRFWRDLTNIPRFFKHVEAVKVLDERRSHWSVKGPAGSQLQWIAQIVTDHPPELISWESLPGAEVQNAGSVRFEPEQGGTRVKVTLQYQPPAGLVGAAVAKLFGEAPDQQLAEDLGEFKKLLESSPLPATTNVQP
jgi:uncharacterized membrane protein